MAVALIVTQIGAAVLAYTAQVSQQRLVVATIRQPTKEHLYRRFREAWDSVNLSVPGAHPIPLAIDERVVRAAWPMKARRQDGWTTCDASCDR